MDRAKGKSMEYRPKKLKLRELIAGYKVIFCSPKTETRELLLYFMENDLRAKGYIVIKGEDEVLIIKKEVV